jgi:hypothetical protein
MKVSLIGNCQIACVRPMLQSIHTDLECVSFPAVHHMNGSLRGMIEDHLNRSDWIFTQPIQDTYHVEYARTSYLKALYGSRVVVWPNCYYAGYAPEWNVLRDVERKNYTGPLLDYHSSKIIYSYFKGFSVADTQKFLDQASEFDERNYCNSARNELDQLKSRESETDIIITDYIESNYRTTRLFHIMNHPNLLVMAQVAMRLLDKVNEKFKQVPVELLTDTDLISAWHPENPYIRETQKFSFVSPSLYRGTRIIRDSNITGFRTEGIRLYSSSEIVEAFFEFYKANHDSLRAHERTNKILSAN